MIAIDDIYNWVERDCQSLEMGKRSSNQSQKIQSRRRDLKINTPHESWKLIFYLNLFKRFSKTHQTPTQPTLLTTINPMTQTGGHSLKIVGTDFGL